MYKMIVCDLDETLMNDDGTLSKTNAEAIKKASAKGVYFVPNSGRSYVSFQNVLEPLGLRDKAKQYSISYNGGLILENKGNRPIATNAMPFEIAQKVFDVGSKNPHAATHVYTQDALYVYHPVPEDDAYLKNRGVDYKEMKTPDLGRFKDVNIMKVIMALPTVSERKQMKADVEAVVGADNIAGTFSSGRYIEFNPAGINKGSASVQLGELLGIKPEEIIGAGDNSNDLPMLRDVGLPVSVANGIDSVKEAAKYITIADNNHDALAEVINKFIL
ncbi:Cof-type HAD-IIB family hydrolase [Companilactobacillus versmoldensis]|nr:Cof-type HAD-IIB family hydrolase [Companilactobacillus versmoldensis]